MPADVKMAVTHRNGADDFFTERIRGKQLKLGSSFEDKTVASLVGGVAFAIGAEHER
jgi:hypothetical protein